MKTLLTLFAFIILPLSITAQDDEPLQTLFGRDKGATGWYIEFPHSYSKLYANPVLTPGFGAGFVAGHTMAIGFRAQGFSGGDNQLFFKDAFGGEGAYLEGGYAGLLMESKITPSQPVHLTLPVLFAIGGASYTSTNTYPEWDEGELDFHRKVLATDAFLVFEPGVQMEINVLRFMRFSMGAGYRWVRGMDLQDVKSNVLNGTTFTTSLKFGKF